MAHAESPRCLLRYPALRMNSSWTGYLLGPVYASLPKRWRYVEHHGSARFMARCAMLSGVLESLLALSVLRYWYMRFFDVIGTAYGNVVTNSKDESPVTKIAPEFIGGAGFFVVAWHPITWVILYFFVEGILRMAAAVITGETYGVLPLWAADFIYRRALRRHPGPELPLVSDEVLPGDATCDLKVASCRKRPGWEYPFTIRYQQAFFQVTAAQIGKSGPRPYMYFLRRLPPGEIARGLRDYHPDDVLRPIARVHSMG